MSTNYYLHVLTAKGLAFLVRNHKDETDMQVHVRQELGRRKLRNESLPDVPVRPVDGYERDR